MRLCFVVLNVLCAVSVSATVQSTDPTVVQVSDGSIKGEIVANGNVLQWLGIPFAAPPVGKLRFVNPQPVTPWTGTMNATEWKPDCPQNSPDYPTYSEDCLYINVWKPAHTALMPSTDPLPVLLYICGGAFIHCGALREPASQAIWDPKFVVNQTNHVPVVYVTFNYRLNAFGYLGSDRMRFLNADNSTGNAGQWDQHAAMLWVKKNIAAFGGDPGRVTIMGESAGAGSVSDHLAMPASRGLFHGAIIESGAPMSWTSQPLEDAEKNLVAMANAVGCDPDSGAVVACLQAADMQQLLDASDRNASFSIKHLAHPPWTPVVDGVTFLDAPDRVAAAGNTTKVPIIVGSNSNEGTLFVTSVPRNVSALVYSGFLAKVFGFELAIKVGLHYFSTNYESPWWALAAVVGDYLFACPARRLAENVGGDVQFPVYLYRFSHIPSYLKAANVGVEHSAELIFVWHFLPMLNGTDELSLSDEMVQRWTQFMTTGNPNLQIPGKLTWPEYAPSTDINMDFNLTLSLQTNLQQAHCDFWDSVYDDANNADVLKHAAHVLMNLHSGMFE